MLTGPVVRPTYPPTPAMIALVLAAAYPARAAYLVTVGLLHHDLFVLAPVLTLGLWGLLLSGLWRGSWMAHVGVVVAAALTIVGAAPDLTGDTVYAAVRVVLGVALLLLLLGPRSSRAFYDRKTQLSKRI